MSYQIDFEPVGRRVQVTEPVSILQAARDAGVGLAAVCGGAGTCGRCRVRVLHGRVSSPTAAELEVLAVDELAAGFRLACQTEVLGDLKVHVPPSSLTASQRLQVEGRDLPVIPAPPVTAHAVRLSAPSRTDLRSDEARLHAALPAPDLDVDVAVLHQMPAILREYDWTATVGLRERGGVVSIHPPGTTLLGLAVDVGTTKIAGYLVELAGGRTLATAGVMNPQIAYGEDVMARISYAMESPEQAGELQRVVVQALNELARDLCGRVKRAPEDIVEAVVVGNTAMHHLFLGLPVSQLGLAPYLPAVSDELDVKARDVGLEIAPGGYVHLLPNIAGFVGADHVAMLLATGIHDADHVVIGLDIGTNTEVALRVGDRLFTCSTASGPAFEGAHIRDGMRATAGAIERVRVAGDRMEYQTIDGAPPVGLCGSGILDAVAGLRQAGIIDGRGVMASHPRVRRGQNGPEFVVVEAAETGHGRDLVLTRRDVGEIQLAKGAMRAGVNILLEEAALKEDDVDEVVIAGAFGTYIDVHSAVAIGMFPPLPEGCFHQVGNAAGMGARMALISTEQRALAARIARHAEYVELTNCPLFMEEFARAMVLP
ncbi:MAG: ASKHA domain-containing protein [Chloroflexota bacterium]|nr:ASKHA domain-containing protein [Chloroflexota bacterium]